MVMAYIILYYIAEPLHLWVLGILNLHIWLLRNYVTQYIKILVPQKKLKTKFYMGNEDPALQLRIDYQKMLP